MPLNISKTHVLCDRVGEVRRASPTRPALALCMGVLALSGAGCQLVMDDIVPKSEDGGSVEDANVDTSTLPDTSITEPRDAAPMDAGQDAESGAPPAADAAAAADTAVEAAPADTDIPEPDPGACDGAGERVFYRDFDKDGYGDATKWTVGCAAPAGHVDNADDCQDRSAEVHPGQTQFFADPYEVERTTNSFDYDCNGRELGAPGLAPGQPCTGGVLSCSGGGYEPNPDRAGMPRANPYCGSNVYLQCPTILGPLTEGCGSGTRMNVSDRFLCN